MNNKIIFNRPLTPHLTIYSSQLTSVYSIWHRITGILLVLTSIFLIISIKFNLYNFHGFKLMFLFTINLWFKNAIFFNIILFFSYHMLNGIKHIIWDLGYILPIKKIFMSANFINLALLIYTLFLIKQILN